MDFLDISFSGEPGMAIIAIVAFGAGLVRGFTGFGGPAFILAILTLFFTPYSIVSKILVVDFSPAFSCSGRFIAKSTGARPRAW